MSQGQVEVETADSLHSKPPDAWRLKDTSRENDYNCITQKDTQPSQTCLKSGKPKKPNDKAWYPKLYEKWPKSGCIESTKTTVNLSRLKEAKSAFFLNVDGQHVG